MKVKSVSRVQLLATPWTAAYQAPLSMGFSRQEYWSGVPLSSPKKRFSPGEKEDLISEWSGASHLTSLTLNLSYKIRKL